MDDQVIEFTGTISNDLINPQKRKASNTLYYSIISRFNSKNRLQKYIVFFLIATIFILSIIFLCALYNYLKLMTALPSKSNTLKNLIHEHTTIKTSKSAINTKRLKHALKMVSYKNKIKKSLAIEAILRHEILHLTYKNLPYYDQFRDIISQSILLRGIDDIGLIYTWFPSKRLTFKDIRMKLIYRASRDGDDSNNFHRKCDDEGSNIVLIKTKSSDIQNSFYIGGFTTVPISSKRKQQWVETGLTYVFELDSPKKFKVSKIFNTIIHGYDVLLNYSNALILSDKFLTNDKGIIIDSFEDSSILKEEPFTGKSYLIEDVEVFSVYVEKDNST